MLWFMRVIVFLAQSGTFLIGHHLGRHSLGSTRKTHHYGVPSKIIKTVSNLKRTPKSALWGDFRMEAKTLHQKQPVPDWDGTLIPGGWVGGQ
jgi:hypothetical protein